MLRFLNYCSPLWNLKEQNQHFISYASSSSSWDWDALRHLMKPWGTAVPLKWLRQADRGFYRPWQMAPSGLAAILTLWPVCSSSVLIGPHLSTLQPPPPTTFLPSFPRSHDCLSSRYEWLLNYTPLLGRHRLPVHIWPNNPEKYNSSLAI